VAALVPSFKSQRTNFQPAMEKNSEKRLELLGLALTAFGVQFSVGANSLVKTVNNVPVLQAMQLRFLVQFCFTLSAGLVWRCSGRPLNLLGQPQHRLMLLGRAVFFAIAILSSWSALRELPVGNSTTIVYLYPAICGILANRFLGENLGLQFWSQAGICFAGVLLVTGGGAHDLGLSYYRGVMLAMLASFSFAATNCFVRALRGAETIEVQLFTDIVMAFVVMPLCLIATSTVGDWSSWDANLFLRLLGATLFGLCALVIVVLGHQLAPASKATLFTYLEVPSSFLVQGLLFGRMPEAREAAGVLLILGAAIYRFWYEAKRATQMDPEPLLSDSPKHMLRATNRLGSV